MRFFIIDTYYPAFLESFYRVNPEARSLSYKEQKRLLLAKCFGTADFYSQNLKKLGHEADEFIINNEILQRRWAQENGLKLSRSLFNILAKIPKFHRFIPRGWIYEVLEAQILSFKPDIVFVQDIAFTQPEFLRRVKPLGRGMVGHISSRLPSWKHFEPYDLLLSSFPHFIPLFRERGLRAEYIRLAFEPRLLNLIHKKEQRYDVVLVGGIVSKYHTESITILEAAARRVKIDFWGYGRELLSSDSTILKSHHGEAWGLDMYNLLYHSKISINRHGNLAVTGGYANNMRLYEATGMGTMLLTDWKPNLHELFEIGQEVETYQTADELAGKIKYYLDPAHDKERQAVARAGQARTLRDHTYEIRMRELVDIISRYL